MNNKEVEEKHKEMTEKTNDFLKKDHPEYKPKEYKFVAVGYLDITEPDYKVGEVPEGFIEKLRLLFDTGTVCGAMGHHDCEFCLNQGVNVRDLPKEAMSSSEKTLIDEVNNIKYMFPEMLFHYISIHLF